MDNCGYSSGSLVCQVEYALSGIPTTYSAIITASAVSLTLLGVEPTGSSTSGTGSTNNNGSGSTNNNGSTSTQSNGALRGSFSSAALLGVVGAAMIALN